MKKEPIEYSSHEVRFLEKQGDELKESTLRDVSANLQEDLLSSIQSNILQGILPAIHKSIQQNIQQDIIQSILPAIRQSIQQDIQQIILPAIHQNIQQEIQEFILPIVQQTTNIPLTFLRKIYHTINKWKNATLLAGIYHPGVFQKYKGIHSGQDIVIVGAGPTLDDYVPIPNAIHIGVNRTYLKKGIKLDYLFMQDGGKKNETAALTKYRKGKCKRFFGIHPVPHVGLIKESYAEKNEAERYYFDIADPDDKYWTWPSDLAHQPLISICSTVTVAFQFALWCTPRRIYLVGCDCTLSGYFSVDKELQQTLNADGLIKEWRRLAEFARRNYPGVKIISINPVGLKGLFKEIKMKAEIQPRPKKKSNCASCKSKEKKDI